MLVYLSHHLLESLHKHSVDVTMVSKIFRTLRTFHLFIERYRSVLQTLSIFWRTRYTNKTITHSYTITNQHPLMTHSHKFKKSTQLPDSHKLTQHTHIRFPHIFTSHIYIIAQTDSMLTKFVLSQNPFFLGKWFLFTGRLNR